MSKSRSSPQFRLPPHPWDSSPADAIDRRVAHLRGVFGIIGSLCPPKASEITVNADDLGNLTWLVQDYLHDITTCRELADKEVR